MQTSEVQSGERLESLVLIVLLIRCLTGKFCNLFSPGERFEKDCGVSFNRMKAGERIYSENIKTWEELKRAMHPQTQLAVYYPPHAKFEGLDVVVAAWLSKSSVEYYGFQMREGGNAHRRVPQME